MNSVIKYAIRHLEQIELRDKSTKTKDFSNDIVNYVQYMYISAYIAVKRKVICLTEYSKI